MLALRVLSWVRQHRWMRAAYRFLPPGLRANLRESLVEASGSSASFKRTPAWDRPAPEAVRVPGQSSPGDADGVHLYAYFRGQFGLAECARLYTHALLEHGYAVSLHDIELDVPHGFDDRSFHLESDDGVEHGVHLLFVNPDYLDAAMDKVGRARFEGGHVIACWFWELERIPDSWLPALAQVDEILVASAFIEEAFARITDKPVFRLPIPLGEPQDSGLSRADFGLEDDRFIFLSTFDFNSSIERKNPFAVVEAFGEAFPPDRDDVRLLIKSSNGHRYPQRFLALLQQAAADPRILVRDEILEGPHLHALQRCIDAYVSLHRAEGFGLGMAECMRLGKPVIATGWSGNMEFMGDEDSCLVDHEIRPLVEGEYPFWQGQRWAEPDVSHAARCMRRLVDDPAMAAALGDRAAIHIKETLSPRLIGAKLAAHLDSARTAHRGRATTPPSGSPRTDHDRRIP